MRLLLEIDQEDSVIPKLGKLSRFISPCWLLLQDGAAHVAEEAVLLLDILEVEVAIESRGGCLRDEEQVNAFGFVLTPRSVTTCTCVPVLTRRRRRAHAAPQTFIAARA